MASIVVNSISLPSIAEFIFTPHNSQALTVLCSISSVSSKQSWPKKCTQRINALHCPTRSVDKHTKTCLRHHFKLDQRWELHPTPRGWTRKQSRIDNLYHHSELSQWWELHPTPRGWTRKKSSQIIAARYVVLQLSFQNLYAPWHQVQELLMKVSLRSLSSSTTSISPNHCNISICAPQLSGAAHHHSRCSRHSQCWWS